MNPREAHVADQRPVMGPSDHGVQWAAGTSARRGARAKSRSLWVWAILAAATAASASGDPARGLEWLRQRHESGCVLCHVVPGVASGGEIGPPLLDLWTRYDAESLASRIADARRFNAQTVMPPYRSTEGLREVAAAYRGRPLLTEQALQDIVRYLMTRPATATEGLARGPSDTARAAPAAPAAP